MRWILLFLILPAFADFDSALSYSLQYNGTALLIAEGNEVVYEDFRRARDEPVFIASGTKTFTGLAALAAIDDGIASFSDIVGPRSVITLEQSVYLISGLKPDYHAIGAPCLARDDCWSSYRERIENYLLYRPSPFRAFPGTDFVYGPLDFNVYGFAISDAIGPGEHLIDWAYTRLFDPLGVEIPRWDTDDVGEKRFASGAWINADNWLRWARFMASDGEGLISPALMDKMRTPSTINPGYGISVWTNFAGGEGPSGQPVAPNGGGWIYYDGFEDIFMAAGNGDNFAMVLPSLDLIVIRQCYGLGAPNAPEDDEQPCLNGFSYNDFVEELLR
jgi:CubicO group peptidase (beta-lactamase class C family)